MAGEMWESTVMTEKGIALLAKLTTGNTLNFTKIRSGAGMVDASLLSSQTAVTDIKQEFLFNKQPSYDNNKAKLQVILTNDNLEMGYDCHQIGIYANDPDEGEILYLIMQTANPLSVPDYATLKGYTAEFNISVAYGLASSVTVELNPAGILTPTTANEMYMPLVEYANAQYRFGMDENGVYITDEI